LKRQGSVRRAGVVVLLAFVGGCMLDGPPPRLPDKPVAPAEVSNLPAPPPVSRPRWAPPPTAKLAVMLSWTDAADLDLYVTDPNGQTVYFAHPRSDSGGTLIADARCKDATYGERHEGVFWTDPPSGRYRIGVDFIEPCVAGVRAATFEVTVEVDGRREKRQRGSVRAEQRDPRVLEFTLP
jgi:hypothetical protein